MDETDRRPNKNILQPSGFNDVLERLAHAESIAPIRQSELDLSAMRQQLIDGGCNLELTPEMRHVLLKPQFRSLRQGKGPAVVEVLGEDRAKKLPTLCQQIGHRRLEDVETHEPIEESRGRGEMQTAARFLALAIFEKDPNQIKTTLRLLNGSILRGAGVQFPDNFNEIEARFNKAGIQKPDRNTASVLPKNLYPIWMFLTGHEYQIK